MHHIHISLTKMCVFFSICSLGTFRTLESGSKEFHARSKNAGENCTLVLHSISCLTELNELLSFILQFTLMIRLTGGVSHKGWIVLSSLSVVALIWESLQSLWEPAECQNFIIPELLTLSNLASSYRKVVGRAGEQRGCFVFSGKPTKMGLRFEVST